MSVVLEQTLYTAEEYLALERSAPYKSEFHDGQIYAMNGASRKHNLITVNIGRELSLQLKKRPCEAYSNDMRVKAAEAKATITRTSLLCVVRRNLRMDSLILCSTRLC
jgi:Uma2 family endonuclease